MELKAKSETWWTHDIATNEEVKIDALTSTYVLHQLISEPIHLLLNSSLSIDLTLINQPNLVVDKEVYSTLHPT